MIRADAGSGIGAGHFMRTLALGEAWIEQRGETIFLTRCDIPALLERVIQAGIKVVPLAASDLPTDLAATLRQLEASRGSGANPWICVDGYFFTPEYHAAIRAAGYPLLVIDDNAHLPQYHASILLNQNIGAESLRYATDPDTKRLLGPAHTLLRSEFRRRPPSPRYHPPVAKRVLVTCGGADTARMTARIVSALLGSEVEGIEIVAVMGAASPNREEVERLAAAATGNTLQVVCDPPEMRELLESVDLVVTAAGSTCWEISYLGLPALLIVVADNQRGIADGLHRCGAAVSLGWHESVDTDMLQASFRSLATDPQGRAKLSQKSREVVDGQGVLRVIQAVAGAFQTKRF